MLNIFQIDRGRKHCLKTELAFGTVEKLQKAIQTELDGSPCELMLLLGDGTRLDRDKQVTYYSGAGTEGNPIFLVSRHLSNMNQSYSVAGTSRESLELNSRIRQELQSSR